MRIGGGVLLGLLLCPWASGQQNRFVGAYFGVSTLSADARTDVTVTGARFSSYKPENGPTAVVFAGRHLNDYFSAMTSYGWNRNSALLVSGEAGTSVNAISRDYLGTMHTFLGEGLLYFRSRRSRVRPYLSAGAGLAHTKATARGVPIAIGRPAEAPPRFARTGPAFRVAVGIDLFFTMRTAFRYSFSETIQGNPFSEALTPPGARKLANFQNWFGVAYYF